MKKQPTAAAPEKKSTIKSKLDDAIQNLVKKQAVKKQQEQKKGEDGAKKDNNTSNQQIQLDNNKKKDSEVKSISKPKDTDKKNNLKSSSVYQTLPKGKN